MSSVLIVLSEKHDPWYNLALEEYLLELQQKENLQAVLYLWQNQDTVVIGRNQNAWTECLTGLLESEGGRLARRSTGGGAVFHDLGNLNFSLILPRKRFNLDDNFAMILAALSSQGIIAERSGRNDILAGGLKFSGNAFSLRESVGLHHGTLLVHSDYSRVARYLTVSPAKLQAKGISSVRSRITNLQAINPEVTVESLSAALEKAFLERFSPEPGNRQIRYATDTDFQDDPRLEQLHGRFASWNWRYGEALKFDAIVEHRMDWGMVQLGFQVEKGKISQANLYTDALDCDFIDTLPAIFIGHRFNSDDLAAAVMNTPCHGEGFGPSRRQMIDDLADLIREQNW